MGLCAGNLAFNVENKKAITDAGAIPKLVDILTTGHTSLRLEAIIALGTLAHKSAENKVSIAAAGAVPALIGLLKRSSGKAIFKCNLMLCLLDFIYLFLLLCFFFRSVIFFTSFLCFFLI